MAKPTPLHSLQSKLTELDAFDDEGTQVLTSGLSFLEEVEDDTLFRFTQEYTKLLAVLQRTMAQSNKLREKFQDAIQEVQQVDQTWIDVSKLSHDQATLKTLRNQIARAEVLLLASNKREESTKNEMRQIRFDISNLQSTMKQGVGLSAAQERTISDLVHQKEQHQKELEQELDRIVSLRTGVTSISERMEQAEQECKHIEKEIWNLKEKNTQKKLEIDMELKNKERLERELRELRVVVTMKSQEAVAKQSSVNKATEEIASIETQIRNQKAMMEKLLKDQESLGTRTLKLQQDYDEQMDLTKMLMQENQVALSEWKIKERELASHKAEVNKVNKIKDLLVNKSRILEEQKQSAENERRVHRETNEQLLREIDKIAKTVEGIKKNIDDLSRERDILQTSIKKTVFETGKVQTLLFLQKQQQATMELETARLRREKHENEKILAQIQQELDRYVQETKTLQQQIQQAHHDLKQKEVEMYEYKKQTMASENKLKVQLNLYEQVQSDRKLYAKQLVDSQAQIAEMKRRLKIMNFQINGFKDDVNTKSNQLQKETAELVKLKKDSELIQEEIKNVKMQNELAAAYIKTQMVEEYKLDTFVKEAEIEKQRQQTQLDLIVAERDSLNHQLLRRNQELTSVYNTIKTLSLDLTRGEIHYAQQVSKIQKLREQVLEARKQVFDLQVETQQVPELKRVMMMLQNQIRESQTKIKALEEELVYPVNVHRWRTLEGSNPQRFEMISLVHTLQKQLLMKTKQEKEKEEQIQNQEQLYLHLKSVLAKQAGPEQLEQIQEYQKLVKEKAMMLRHMDTELNMYKAQCEEYRYDIEKMDKELAELKQVFLQRYQKGLPPLPRIEEEDHVSDMGRNTESVVSGSVVSQ
jgi:hypothetical protein